MQTIELSPAVGVARGFSRATPGAGSVVAPRTTEEFSLLGATWTDPSAALPGTVQVRTRSVADGTWTPWQTLEADEPNPAEPGSGDAEGNRGSTDPLWVGPSDGIEARVAAPAGSPRCRPGCAST